MDRGYDNNRVYYECEQRGVAPVVPLRKGRNEQPCRIPRHTPEWRTLYRRRSAVEREFGRLKHEYGLANLRVRGLAKVALHADLCILGRLAVALSRARSTTSGVARYLVGAASESDILRRMVDVLREAEAVMAKSQPRDYAPLPSWSRWRVLADATLAGVASLAPTLGGTLPVDAPVWGAEPWRDRFALAHDAWRTTYQFAHANSLALEPWVHPDQGQLFDPDAKNGD
jgi:hypothetical protein